jgi:hypothetical protein
VTSSKAAPKTKGERVARKGGEHLAHN